MAPFLRITFLAAAITLLIVPAVQTVAHLPEPTPAVDEHRQLAPLPNVGAALKRDGRLAGPINAWSPTISASAH